MAFSYSTAIKNDMLNNSANSGKGLTESLNGGIMEIYTAPRPANADSAITGSTLLATVTKDGLAVVPGVLTNGLVWDVAANGVIDKPAADSWLYTGASNGVAAWFRIKGNAADNDAASTTLPRVDGSIASFGGDAQLTDVNIITGKISNCDSCEFSFS